MVVELGLAGVSVAVVGSAGFEVLAQSGEDAEALDDLQFVLGEGPTADAYRAGRPVLVPDLSSEGTRWLQFASAAQSRGVGGAYAFPLQLGGVRSGVLTVYCETGRSLDQRELNECLTRADAARDVLLGALEGSANGVANVSLSVPLRTVVYQAQGMLMVALGVSLVDALTRLRAMAYAEGLDLNQLATELVNGDRAMPTTEREAQ